MRVENGLEKIPDRVRGLNFLRLRKKLTFSETLERAHSAWEPLAASLLN
jgi:hypothetical protein